MREVSYVIFELEQPQIEYVGLYTTVKCMGQCLGGWVGRQQAQFVQHNE